MRRVLVLAVALSLSACASLPAGGNSSASEPLGALARFTLEDLSAALADATAHNDLTGAVCWSSLIEVLDSVSLPAPPRIIGIASAVQAKRDLLGGGASGKLKALRERINLGCAALFVDENVTLIKLGAPLLGIPIPALP